MNRIAIAAAALAVATTSGCPDPLTDGPPGTGGNGAEGAGTTTTDPSGGNPVNGGAGSGGAPSNVCVLDSSQLDQCVLQ